MTDISHNVQQGKTKTLPTASPSRPARRQSSAIRLVSPLTPNAVSPLGRRGSISPSKLSLRRDESIQYQAGSNYIPPESSGGANVGLTLPAIGLRNPESTVEVNPFTLPSVTERVLAMGERKRELEGLTEKKYKYGQVQSQGSGDYLEQLSQKQIGYNSTRQGAIEAVRQIGGGVVSLKPHINKKASEESRAFETTQVGGSSGAQLGAEQSMLSPSKNSIASKRFSQQTESRAMHLSPLKIEPRRGSASKARFMSPPSVKPLDFNDPMRYLNSEKQQEKTSPRDYILANRQILTHQIVNQDKKDYLD